MSSKAEKTVLWVSHILVMHRGSAPDGKLRTTDWFPDARADRSERDAREILRKIGDEVRSDPSKFEAAAQRSSEDIVTRDRGGSLGGLRPDQMPPSFVDAVEALPWGGVSDIISTPLGFHIILKRSPPPKQDVTGYRVVLRYGARAPSQRSRQDAWNEGRSLAKAARDGQDFVELVESRSEGSDNVRRGRLGTWSTIESSPTPLVLETLAKLDVGQVSDPVDSPDGFQIVKRAPLEDVYELAARTIRIPIASGNADRENDVTSPAATQAKNIHEAVLRNPGSFGKWHNVFCCAGTEKWVDGHGDATLTNEVDKLKFGEIAPSLIKLQREWVIAQRMDPEALPAREEPFLTLPDADRVQLEVVFVNLSQQTLSGYVKEVKQALASGRVPKAQQDTIDHAFDLLSNKLSTSKTREDQTAAYQEATSILYRSLPAATYSALMAFIQGWALHKQQARLAASPAP